jgi:hypothetical protein
MTTSESITVSLEWAIKLLKSGWNQSGSNFIISDSGKPQYGEVRYRYNQPMDEKGELIGKWLAAPTASELFEEMFEYTEVQKYSIGYRAALPHLADEHPTLGYQEDMLYVSPQDSLAAMWIYLKENNLLPSES